MLQIWLLVAVLGFGLLLILCVVVMITIVLCTYTSYSDRSQAVTLTRLLTDIQYWSNLCMVHTRRLR